MTFEDPRKVLARHGLRPKRALSQNFLCSSHAVAAIADAIVADPGQTVVELGPGCGTLTAALLARGARVWAIERDREMRALLAAEFAEVPLVVRDGDAATIDYQALRQELNGPVRVVGNLPYAITGVILRRLIDDHAALCDAVVMVQREVADRLVAAPGTAGYGALTVFAHNVFSITRVARVPRTAFYPPPKVDSAVLKMTPRRAPLTVPDPILQAVVQSAFQARRKHLRNALLRLPGADRVRVRAALVAAGIDPGVRGERLHVTDFGRLAAALKALNAMS